MMNTVTHTATAAANGSYPGSQSPDSLGHFELPTAGAMTAIAMIETMRQRSEVSVIASRVVEHDTGSEGHRLACWCRRRRRASSKVWIISVNQRASPAAPARAQGGSAERLAGDGREALNEAVRYSAQLDSYLQEAVATSGVARFSLAPS